MSIIQLTSPPTVYQAVSEDITYGIDTTNLGGTPTVLLVTLVYGTGTVSLEDAATVDGNVIVQRVRAGVLKSTVTYQLTAHWSPPDSTNVYESILQIICNIS